MAERVLSESLPAGVTERTWGVLTAISDSAKQRAQGLHIFLTAQEHVLGRAVKDPAFLFESPSISARHCRVFRKNATVDSKEVSGVFVKDSSSNGTYVNGQRLRKDSPELRIQHGDVISLAALPELAAENGFAYVYRETGSGLASLKRKPEDEITKDDASKKAKASEGPVNLADVRRLERSNQELRQRLESECFKADSLNADLRAAKSSTENMVKDAIDQCKAEYSLKIDSFQNQLSEKTTALNDYTAKCVQLESVVDDLNKRVLAAAVSRSEAEEALKGLKANRDELEKQLERERNQSKMERDEAEQLHKSAVDRLRAEAADEMKRQAELYARQQKVLEDEVLVLQESKDEYRAQIEDLTGRLEKERENCMDFDKKGQELQILLNSEQRTSFLLREELESTGRDLQQTLEQLKTCKGERDSANAKVAALQQDKEDMLSKLKLENQRFEGAKDRIMLRETQLRSFQATAEEIEALQQKQQEQLRAMMKTLEDDDAEYANAAGNLLGNDERDSKTVDEDDAKDGPDDMDITSGGATQELPDGATATCPLDLNETPLEESPHLGTTQPVPTQLVPTQQFDATQLMDGPAVMATQPAAEAGGTQPGTPQMEAQADDRSQALETLLAETPARSERGPSRRKDIAEVRQREGSLCTADLLTSEAAGSWANDSPPDNEDAEVNNEGREQVFPGSQVGNSDSLQVRRLSSQRSGFNDTMASQNSPRAVPLVAAPDSEDGSDTEEE